MTLEYNHQLITPFTDDMLKEHDFKDRKELTESMFMCMKKFSGIG